jgi:hypothetical protein
MTDFTSTIMHKTGPMRKRSKTGSVNRIAGTPRVRHNSAGMEGDIIFYQFSRSKVERCDFSHFLSLYAPDKLPTGRRLREMMNVMMFGIEGYDDDPVKYTASRRFAGSIRLFTRRGPTGFISAIWIPRR